jgi:anti-sigma regulatory factor (Ser/Thr protein kinase)
VTNEPDTVPHLERIEMAAVPPAAKLARGFVRRTLRTWSLDRLVPDAELVVSELVSNAVKATVTAGPASVPPVAVELRLGEGVVRIAVQDISQGQPVCRRPDESAEGGRGLFLVEALSLRWDVSFVTGGKVTWAELTLPQRPAYPSPG